MENENLLKDRILKAARSKFKTTGYRGVKTDDIASEVGISKRTLYQHFNSKEDILREVILKENDRIYAAIIEKAEVIRQGNVKFSDMKQGIILDIIMEPIDFFDSATIVEIKRNMHELLKEIEEPCHNKIFIAFKELFNAAKERGFIRSEINSDLFFTIIHSSISDLMDNERHLTLNLNKEEMIRQTLEIMTVGILTPEANGELTQNKVKL